jgi:UDP-N-acetylmuramyl pentapeptide phosphotransferase/UDP-N-acetylglucosamine-1-phosphate transferase
MYEIWERKYWIILILASFIALVSFIDDLDTIDKSYFSLHPMIRLIFQIGIGAIIGITSIKISYISNLLGPLMPGVEIWELSQWMTVINENITIYWIPLIFTIIWYVLVFNSLNWSDGVS